MQECCVQHFSRRSYMDKPNEMIVVLDFGGQYNQLIARRIRDLGVYSELLPYNTPIEDIVKLQPKGIVFSGGPSSVYGEGSPIVDPQIYELDIPIFGICYGMQLMSHQLKGKVEKATRREYGKAMVDFTDDCSLVEGLEKRQQVWMSHSDLVLQPPLGFVIDGSTEHAPVAAMSHPTKKLYAVQFH